MDKFDRAAFEKRLSDPSVDQFRAYEQLAAAHQMVRSNVAYTFGSGKEEEAPQRLHATRLGTVEVQG